MRLIDADVLIARLDYCTTKGMGSTIAFTFKHMIDKQPTIDAVEVVRCKDCKFEKDCTQRGFNDDFCSSGRRKDEDG